MKIIKLIYHTAVPILAAIGVRHLVCISIDKLDERSVVKEQQQKLKSDIVHKWASTTPED